MLLNQKLKYFDLILASGSPRRKEIMEMLGLDFVIKTKPTEEIYPKELSVEKVSEYLANLKADSFAKEIDENPKLIVISADTTVAINNEILGKPKDREDAISMLQKLSGKKHTVFSGVCIKNKAKTTSFTASTDVWFKELSMEEIEYYVDNFKPYDKAGAYAVQEWIGAAAISRIEGSYYNVVGLQSKMLYAELEKFVETL